MRDTENRIINNPKGIIYSHFYRINKSPIPRSHFATSVVRLKFVGQVTPKTSHSHNCFCVLFHLLHLPPPSFSSHYLPPPHPFLYLLSRCKEQSVIGWEQIWFKRLPLKSQPVGFKTHSPASPLTHPPSTPRPSSPPFLCPLFSLAVLMHFTIQQPLAVI